MLCKQTECYSLAGIQTEVQHTQLSQLIQGHGRGGFPLMRRALICIALIHVPCQHHFIRQLKRYHGKLCMACKNTGWRCCGRTSRKAQSARASPASGQMC